MWAVLACFTNSDSLLHVALAWVCLVTKFACPTYNFGALSIAGFIDLVSGGDVVKRLAKVPEIEVTLPDRNDRLVLTAQVHAFREVAVV